jgi:hypothetical protein
MAGRPTKLTPELADDLVVMLAAGMPVGRAAAAAGVPQRTLTRWLRAGLRQQVERARAEQVEAVEALPEARLVGLVTRAARGDWAASAWWLERHYPERWGPAGAVPAARQRPVTARARVGVSGLPRTSLPAAPADRALRAFIHRADELSIRARAR